MDKNSHFNGTFPLVANMKTGRYFFEIIDAESLQYIVNDAVFFVEQYSKPVFKTEVKNTSKDVSSGEKIASNAQASYYFGGVMPNAKVSWAVRAQNYFFDPKDYSQYRFGTDTSLMDCRYWGVCNTSDETLLLSSKNLDSLGKSSFEYTLTLNQEKNIDQKDFEVSVAREKIVTFTSEVEDPNTGKTVSATDSTVVHVTDGYVGLKTPYWTEAKNPIRVTGVTLDINAQPKPKTAVKLEYIRQEWDSVKKTGVDSYGYNDYTLRKTLESTTEVTSETNGEWTNEYTPKQ